MSGLTEYNAHIDHTPIRWSKRLMYIKARLDDPQQPFQHKFVTLEKHTGNTLKKTYTSLHPSTGKICHGSHSHKCYACLQDPKRIQQKHSDFKRFNVKKAIADSY